MFQNTQNSTQVLQNIYKNNYQTRFVQRRKFNYFAMLTPYLD
jgi:hypothetical protein